MVWNCISNLLQLVVAHERIARRPNAQPSVACGCLCGGDRLGRGPTKRFLPPLARGPTTSGPAALDLVGRASGAGEEVALVVVDQALTSLRPMELMVRAREIVPTAK